MGSDDLRERGGSAMRTVNLMPSAYISADGLYRYDLLRDWGGPQDPQVCWVMLNPSTADATQDDPTIRRCIGFSDSWGYGSLIVVNLYAWRATDPKALLSAPDPIGPENDATIDRATLNADLVVCAWGTKGGIRAALVTQRLVNLGLDLYSLDVTKDGHPKHPLYVRGDTEPSLYRRAPSCAVEYEEEP